MPTQWIPKTKHELITLLGVYWPDSRPQFRRMRKKQLYAIFYNSIYKRAILS